MRFKLERSGTQHLRKGINSRTHSQNGHKHQKASVAERRVADQKQAGTAACAAHVEEPRAEQMKHFISCLLLVLLQQRVLQNESLLAFDMTHAAVRGNCRKSDLCETKAERSRQSTKSSPAPPFPECELPATATKHLKVS